MSVQVWLLILGVASLAVALIGGGIQVQIVNIPPIRPLARWVFGVVGVALTVISFFPSLYTYKEENHSSYPGLNATPAPTQRSEPPPATTSEVSDAPRVRIAHPPDGTGISGKNGAVLKGSAVGLEPTHSVWVFDEDPDGTWKYYFVNDIPIPIVDGQWEFHDYPIGSEEDPIETKYAVVAVLADATCTAELMGIERNSEGDRVMPSLPEGCTIADRVILVKQRP